MAQVASKLPLTCHLASDVAGKLPQDASEEGFWPSRCHLGPSWAFLSPTLAHSGAMLGYLVTLGVFLVIYLVALG